MVLCRSVHSAHSVRIVWKIQFVEFFFVCDFFDDVKSYMLLSK